MASRMMKGLLGAAAFGALTLGTAHADDASNIRNGAIGYALTTLHWATYQTPDAKECPHGFNDGPREQFKALFPEGKRKYTLVETQIAREAEGWHPKNDDDHGFVYYEPQTTTAIGLNLDGKVGPHDFTSPDGEKGIDNQMYRVLGCVDNYRGPDGSYRHFIQDYMRKFNYNRWLFELSNVDDLTNDDDITVTLYRGKDPLMVDTLGAYTPGSTQRIDFRWGKSFVYKLRGKIKDGVLTTEPADITFPESQARGVPYLSVHAWRAKLKLTPESAEGLMAGYTDIERYYNSLGQNWSTHHRSYGAEPMTSEYRSMRKNADGYPDPKTGENTAISMAWEIKFVQAYILHEERGEQAISSTQGGGGAKADVAGE